MPLPQTRASEASAPRLRLLLLLLHRNAGRRHLMFLTTGIAAIDDLRWCRLPPSKRRRAKALLAGKWVFKTHGDLNERSEPALKQRASTNKVRNTVGDVTS